MLFTGGLDLGPSVVTRLMVSKGFPNEREALAVLKQYVKTVGMEIDWAKPEEERKAGLRTVSYDSVEPGYNAFAVMIDKKGKLVEIRYSMAL